MGRVPYISILRCGKEASTFTHLPLSQNERASFQGRFFSKTNDVFTASYPSRK